jgi:Putative auto-transporter adhesin, head GIN domain
MLYMRKVYFFAILLVTGSKLFSQQLSDSNAQSRIATGFHSIHVSHAFDVYLTQGNQEFLAISARDKKYLPQIKTEVKDGELRVWHDGGNIHDWNTKKMKLKIYVSFINLDKVDVDKDCHVYAVGEWKDNELKKKLLENNFKLNHK